MNDSHRVADEDISLVDVYELLKNGWKTIAALTILGGILSIGAALIMPEKYIARASIQSTRILGEDIEKVDILAEKMRSPTYYSQQTINACSLADDLNATQILSDSLNPSVKKGSSFVSVSFKSRDTKISVGCLNSVLDDVVSNQSALAVPIKSRALNDINIARQRLETAKLRRQQEILQNQERLQISREKLKAAQDFVRGYETNSRRFEFDDGQFSASSLLLATILSKQNEVKDLQIEINDLTRKVSSAITSREDEVLTLERQIVELERSLLEPLTERAKFSTPIHSPANEVEPKRGLMIIGGIAAGGIIGLLIILVRASFRKREEFERFRSP